MSPAFGALAQTLDVVQQPAGLRTGEVRGQRQAGLAAEAVLADVAAELTAEGVGAGVLPDDGVVDGLTRVLVPEQRGLALVGDADGLDVLAGDAGLLDGPGDDLLDVRPDLGGVVLDPARLREDLLVLLLVDGDDASVAVEDDAAAGGGALVDGGDEGPGGVGVGHGVLLEVTGYGAVRTARAERFERAGVFRDPRLGALKRRRRCRCLQRWLRRSGGRPPGPRRSSSRSRPCWAGAEGRGRYADRGHGPG